MLTYRMHEIFYIYFQWFFLESQMIHTLFFVCIVLDTNQFMVYIIQLGCLILMYFSDEPGLLLGGIPVPALYADGFYLGGKEINEKKYVRNAFVEGDAYFNYGDLLYYDKDYFIYFKDRTGDTFRCVTLNLIVRNLTFRHLTQHIFTTILHFFILTFIDGKVKMFPQMR